MLLWVEGWNHWVDYAGTWKSDMKTTPACISILFSLFLFLWCSFQFITRTIIVSLKKFKSLQLCFNGCLGIYVTFLSKLAWWKAVSKSFTTLPFHAGLTLSDLDELQGCKSFVSFELKVITLERLLTAVILCRIVLYMHAYYHKHYTSRQFRYLFQQLSNMDFLTWVKNCVSPCIGYATELENT